jgi:hypothetical protein
MARKYSYSHRPLEVDHLKPEKFKGYLTLGELAREVGKDPSWIKKLERKGRVPEAKRHRIGKIQVRLYSPGAVQEMKQIFAAMRPGRPKVDRK